MIDAQKTSKLMGMGLGVPNSDFDILTARYNTNDIHHDTSRSYSVSYLRRCAVDHAKVDELRLCGVLQNPRLVLQFVLLSSSITIHFLCVSTVTGSYAAKKEIVGGGWK